MKFTFTFLFLLFFALVSFAQNVTGVWKGYFVQSALGGYEDRYKFEVQVAEADNSGIKGVTYSYRSTLFYGKAGLTGLYTKQTKVLTITETKLLEVKIEGKAEACLMTCYLEYSKVGDLETLTGTYTSRRVSDKGDCGSGTVYLEKTKSSDFYKEDIVVERERELAKKNPVSKPKVSVKSPVQDKPTAKVESKKLPPSKSSPRVITRNPPTNTKTNKPTLKPGAEGDLVGSSAQGRRNTEVPQTAVIPPTEQTLKEPKPIIKQPTPRPEVIRKRNNELVKTFYTSANDIKIDLYDNGEIDGDTISVYHNNKLIVSKKRLTDKPITFNIRADENDPQHEFVMVAENLGSIPPNTALMIITAGGKRYELFVTSTEQKNAVVVVEYRPGQDSNK